MGNTLKKGCTKRVIQFHQKRVFTYDTFMCVFVRVFVRVWVGGWEGVR